MRLLGRKKQSKEGYYTILSPKLTWTGRWFSYVPRGVKWIGPRELDTLARREEFKKFLFSTNPYQKTVRWFEPAFDESDK